MAGSGPQRQKAPPTSAWEWVVAGIGLLVVLGTLAVLGWMVVSGGEGSVQPQLQATVIEKQGEFWRVEVRAYNAGRAPAAGLKVKARLRSAAQVLEEAETEFQYLPGHSAREAAVFFRHDPRQAQLELLPCGYEKP